jgi:outer membrane protein TolC
MVYVEVNLPKDRKMIANRSLNLNSELIKCRKTFSYRMSMLSYATMHLNGSCMSDWFRRVLFANIILSFTSAVCGQSPSAPQSLTNAPLSLTSAIQMAEAKYPAIRAAEAQRESAHSAIGVARAAYLPRADMLWQGNRATTNKPNIAPMPQGVVPIPDTPARPTTGQSDWNSLTGVQFAWQPFDFGVRAAQVRVAQSGFESAKQAADLTRLDVEFAAAEAFIDLVAARRQVAVQQAYLQRMEAFAKAVHVLVDNTLRPGADASQSDAQLAMSRTQLIQAQTLESVRLDTLANLLQIPSSQIAIDDQAIIATAPPDILADEPIDAHPAIQQQTALVTQQTELVHQLNRSWAPVFTLYGSVAGLGAGLSSTSSAPLFQGGSAGLAPDTYNWMTALQVTFPALQIFTLRQQKKVQEAQASSAEATRQRMIGDLSAEVKEARAMLNGARLVAQNTPVELAAARLSDQQQQARYQAGLATVIEVTAAKAALAQAEGDDALARLNVWRGLAGVAAAQGNLQPFLQLLKNQP